MTGDPIPTTDTPGIHVMAKPHGAICNLDCAYCFYLDKERLYPGTTDFRMTDAVLEQYIRQVIAAAGGPEIQFAWQGGEPTLMGLDFFRRAVELEKRHCPAGKTVVNALQTNGTLLDDHWCRFLKEERFLVGISLDGPREIHDRYRVDKGGAPTFDRVMRGLELLRSHGVEFNTLTVVSRANEDKASRVYRFLRREGSGFMQFIPLVERLPAGLPPAPAPPGGTPPTDPASLVSPRSVSPEGYGSFLCTIFDQWVRQDVGRIFVQLFDVQLGIRMGLPSTLCVFAKTCGRALALEHNGDLYACDHFVDDAHRLGNIMQHQMTDLADSPPQQRFGADKFDTLPAYCRICPHLASCHGECPKNRFIATPDGEPGLNYLCAGYKLFFSHIEPSMRRMADLLNQERPPADIMREREFWPGS